MSDSKVARYLSAQIDVSDKSQKEIAEICGYNRPNVITMLKKGQTKLPIERIEPMARALNVDPVYLLSLTMEEYQPNAWKAIQGILGFAVTTNEQEMVEIIREATSDKDPHISTKGQRDALFKWAKALT